MTRPALLVPIGELPRTARPSVGPALQAVIARLLTYRWQVSAAVAALTGLFNRALPIDTPRFAGFGAAMVHGHLDAVYDNPWNQSGPFQLVLSYALFQLDRSWTGAIVLHVAGNVAIVLLARWGCIALRRQFDLNRSAVAEFAVGAACVVWLLPGRIWQGHPAEIAIPLMWLATGASARRQRSVATGLFLGLAIGWEPWAVLAAPLGFALNGWRPRVQAAGVTLGTTALTYGPFVLSGRFHMLRYKWPVNAAVSPLHHFFPAIHDVPWPLRCAQAGLSLLVCAAVVLALRPAPALVWLAPSAALVTRFLLDPYIMDYYWSAVIVLSFAGIATLSRRTTLLQAVPLTALAYLPLCVYGPPLRYIVLTLAVIGVLVLVERAAARDEARSSRA